MRALVANAEGRAWVATRVGCHLTPEARGLVAVDERGNVRGGVVYDGWTPNSVQAHVAMDTPVAWRALLPHVLVYPFLGPRGDGVDGREWIVVMIRGGNSKSLAAVRRLGFLEVARIPNGHSVGDDLVLLRLHRSECADLRAPLRKAA